MTLGLVAVSGAAAVTWTQAAENAVRPEAPGSNAGEVWVASTEFKYAPANVRVTAGRMVTLVLDNSGGETEHGLFVPGLGFRLQAKAGEIARKNILVEKPGKYDYTCDLPGHRDAGMMGTLIVVDR